ncbi:ribonuclease P protein component [Methylotetracoccus oryzae]|uniref:ribonuclease P protein component n=1 Tax=Methylotetracoccus oryzae TaxID=1919059 RepID=UPI00111B15C2|nr:ribonuclease P protein component [Methylotetracoccus oryzae]
MSAHSCDFPKSKRLLTKGDYRFVFAEPLRVCDAHLTVLARSNGTSAARLGLAISKKSLRRAVDRNRVKRILREAFRERHAVLPGLDVIVMARNGCAEASSAALRTSFNRHWNQLLQRCAPSSCPSSGPIDSC